MNKEELIKLLTKLNFEEDDINYLSSSFSIIKNYNNEVSNVYIDKFIKGIDFDAIFIEFRNEFKAFFHEYTLDFILLLILTEPLKNIYTINNISVDVYYSTLEDLRYKIEECKKVYGVIGTFVYWWYRNIYNANIFKLGRLEYEYSVSEDDYNRNGIKINKGDNIISIHIPNTGEKLTKESVLESLKTANKFFDNKAIYFCDSWLLYYKNQERFKKGSNLHNFINMFDVYKNVDYKGYDELWRVFDTVVDVNSIDKLKKETSLQRTFIDVIKNKEKTGFGCGVLLKEYYK